MRARPGERDLFLSYLRAIDTCEDLEFHELCGMDKVVTGRIAPHITQYLRIRRVDALYTPSDVVWLIMVWMHAGYRYREMQTDCGVEFRAFARMVGVSKGWQK